MNKSIRQKHCGTAVGLTPKPAFTARSAAWSCKGLRLRFRCCQSFRFKETGVLNTYQLKGIEHDDENCTALRAVAVFSGRSLIARPHQRPSGGRELAGMRKLANKLRRVAKSSKFGIARERE